MRFTVTHGFLAPIFLRFGFELMCPVVEYDFRTPSRSPSLPVARGSAADAAGVFEEMARGSKEVRKSSFLKRLQFFEEQNDDSFS